MRTFRLNYPEVRELEVKKEWSIARGKNSYLLTLAVSVDGKYQSCEYRRLLKNGLWSSIAYPCSIKYPAWAFAKLL